MFGKIKKFFTEVAIELKKVSWTTRRELIDSTWVVIVSSLLLGAFIATTDLVLSRMIAVTVIK
jgi:preprotein translocase subunit SecE